MKKSDLTDKKFGNLTVIKIVGKKNGGLLWECKCACGNVKNIPSTDIKKVKSCGCSRTKDLTGKKFGKLTVVKIVGKKDGSILWECKCACGNTKNITSRDIRNSKSCGCNKTKDLTGKKFGKLTAIKISGIKGRKNSTYVAWECRCDCGNIVKGVRTANLNSGNATSCGCKRFHNKKKYYEKIYSNFKGRGSMSVKYYSTARSGAKKRNIAFKISINDMWNQWEKQDGVCALSGLKLN